MSIKLPLTSLGFRQLNLGDNINLSELWSSFCLNLSKKIGSLLVSGRMLLNINNDDDAQLDEPPCAFKAFTASTVDVSYIFAIAGDFIWRSEGGHNTTFEQDATLNTPTSCDSDVSDLCVNTNLFVTQASTTVKYIDTGGTWSSATNTLANSSGMHQMTFFRAQNRVYVVDDNAAGISSISGTTILAVAASTQYTLNDLVEGSGVNVGSSISCIGSNSSRIGIGTINKSGSECKFYKWDGSQSSGPNGYHKIDASGVLAQTILDDEFVVFDTKGRLLQLNGGDNGTFVELAKLPLEGASLKVPISTATSRPVHYNGMSINEEGNIEILINTQLWDTNGTVKENCPSGVWCYDRKTKNFYHKRGFGLTKSGGTITDYGASKLSLVGALAHVEVVTTDITQGSINGKLLAGVQYYTDATTTKNGLFYDDSNDTLQKVGIFVTGKIFSSNVKEAWKQTIARIRKFLSSTDRIVVKYQVSDNEPVEATITYTSTTTLTVPTASFSTAPSVGYEIEILQGVGAGRCPHITAISTSGSNYVITVDETITGATTQTAKGRFQNWKKSVSFSNQTDDIPNFPFPSELGASSWVKIKIWCLFTGKNEIYDMIFESNVNKKIE